MLGDLILAEPQALIGFAGPRVIRETIGQDLPEGFQTSEYLLDHGQLDAIVSRHSMREALARFLRQFLALPAVEDVQADELNQAAVAGGISLVKPAGTDER
jgi:acetyl-CoA carboxylase carboxyl transferase subunit beta